MVIAGEVFPEWYWGPIFFLILYSPLITAVGAGLFLLTRRWVRPWLARAVVSLLGATALVLAGTVVWAQV